jgi:hypothetical protein
MVGAAIELGASTGNGLPSSPHHRHGADRRGITSSRHHHAIKHARHSPDFRSVCASVSVNFVQ